jgi:shikimate kinase
MKGIVLIGFMATGKTTVGKRLAQRLDLEFMDLDDLIEERAGLSIKEIFARHGEPGFRKMESEALAAISPGRPRVLATGGGVVLDTVNRHALRKLGLVIHLRARPEVILRRAENERHRPLLETGDRAERIVRLLAERAPLYAMADVEVDTSGMSIEEIVEMILQHVKEPSDG